jgi:hypothetical protein
MIHALSRLLLFVYFLETGLLLVVVPWSVFWERNLFVSDQPVVRQLLLNHYFRGAVSGIGVVCLAAALGELRTFWRRPRQRVEPAGAPASGGDLLP